MFSEGKPRQQPRSKVAIPCPAAGSPRCSRASRIKVLAAVQAGRGHQRATMQARPRRLASRGRCASGGAARPSNRRRRLGHRGDGNPSDWTSTRHAHWLRCATFWCAAPAAGSRPSPGRGAAPRPPAAAAGRCRPMPASSWRAPLRWERRDACRGSPSQQWFWRCSVRRHALHRVLIAMQALETDCGAAPARAHACLLAKRAAAALLGQATDGWQPVPRK